MSPLDPERIAALDAGPATVIDGRLNLKGFSVRLMRGYLYVESWIRVVGGSGQAHVITHEGVVLVEEGFV